MPRPAARSTRWPRKVYRLGDRAGNGSKVKIINQLLAGVHIAAAAEAMALGLREGVDAAALYEVITHSAGNSWMFENRMAHVLAGDYTPLSAVDIFVKDLGPGARHRARDQVSAAAGVAPRTRCSCRRRPPASAKEDDAAVIKIFPGIELPERGQSVANACSAHRRRLHRRHRPCQQRWCAPACAPCRPSACPEAVRRRRCDADAVVVALKSRTIPAARCGGAIARGAALAAGRGRRADLLQVLLDLRFDAARQHRPGDRGADGRARHGRLHDRLPRRSRTTAARSSRAICSSATCCSPRAACATTR